MPSFQNYIRIGISLFDLNTEANYAFYFKTSKNATHAKRFMQFMKKVL